MTILLIAEHDGQQLKNATRHTLTAAEELVRCGATDGIDILVLGYQCQESATDAAQFSGVRRVLLADALPYQHALAENTAACIAALAKEYAYILAPADTFGKNLLPRVAALLDVGMVSDVIQVISRDTFVRPMYAGNALATVQITDAIKCLSIRSTAFRAAEAKTGSAPIEKITQVIANEQVEFIKRTVQTSERPELTSAKIIVAGGRGLKSRENFQRLEKIAEGLGAALGASRAAVDAGFAPNDYQVGQTGKMVAPELYIAIGISGAIQHLAGMKDSKVIVAINNDPDAPIFQVADYGLVADLFQVLPELELAIQHISLRPS